jgi:nucleotide-binding universal stress UspA family protein
MLPVKRILVAVDWSSPSELAFQLAASLAREHEAELAVLYVVPLATVMYGPPPEDYLDHLREKLGRMTPRDPKTRVQSLLAEGDPARAILKTAEDTHCDLIVIGTHGRTGLNRLLSGSVAEEVVRQAPCPVLTVNAQAPARLVGPDDPAGEEMPCGCSEAGGEEGHGHPGP